MQHTGTVVQYCMLYIHKHKTRRTNSLLAHKYIQGKKKKSMKGTALHFVPGYISVGSVGFPELQLQIPCSPSDSSTLGLPQLTQWHYKLKKEKEKEECDRNTLTFKSFPHLIMLCTRCKESFYKPLAEKRNANNCYSSELLFGKLKRL